MMRLFIIYILYNMASFAGQAQGLTIELSVEWKKTEIEFNIPPIQSDTTVNLPFMKLVYRNLSDKDVYFKRIMNDNLYPQMVTGLMNTEMDLAERARNHSSYYGESYKVIISEAWEVLSQDIEWSSIHEFDIINDQLWDIYTVLETQELLNEPGINKQLSCFRYSDKKVVSYREAQRLVAGKRGHEINFSSVEGTSLKENEVSGQYSDAFIFLKAGETYEQEVSLIGFYLLGGSYEFLIPDHSLPGYVVGWNGQKINLPKLVNGYQLYGGDFLTNTVGIKIN